MDSPYAGCCKIPSLSPFFSISLPLLSPLLLLFCLSLSFLSDHPYSRETQILEKEKERKE
jgi:hypothetical protein